MSLNFSRTTLQTIMRPSEYEIFVAIIREIAGQYLDIEGILLTGSLVQNLELPDPIGVEFRGPMQKAYAKIVSRSQRKLWPHLDSDLDIWVMTNDVGGTAELTDLLDKKALELLAYLAEGPDRPLSEWIKSKRAALSEFYKNPDLYNAEWREDGIDNPWEAPHFRRELVRRVAVEMPEFCRRVNYYFRKKCPDNFFEIRVYPGATFNLRPEKIRVEGVIDRTPFPYFIKDWVKREQNALLVLQSDDPKYYPFNENGHVHSRVLADAIGWTPVHVDMLYAQRSNQNGRE
ncbi:MAG: hypothetical protein HYS32_00230 [Candidatus Woesearchaeota archaeon]|nr:MAG: hypothetical protein HYS32_00230 [Candidatus Woesearchaeota archaeon]